MASTSIVVICVEKNKRKETLVAAVVKQSLYSFLDFRFSSCLRPYLLLNNKPLYSSVFHPSNLCHPSNPSHSTHPKLSHS